MKLTGEILLKNGFRYDEWYKIYSLYLPGKPPMSYEIPAVALADHYGATVEQVEDSLNNKNPQGKPDKPIKLKV